MFEKLKVKSLKYKASELPNNPVGKFILPALTAGIENQGLNNYVPKNNATILKNVISISANGANTGATFYQNKEFTVLQDSYAIKWKYTDDSLTDNHYLYLTASISNTIFGNFEWTNKAGWERIKSERIYLPTKNGKIDFDFMEYFIAELEKERISELKAYLKASGLEDYNLTDGEQKALDEFDSMKWGEFRLGELFERIKTNKLPFKASELQKEPIGTYTLPCLTSSFQNQGLNYFAPKDNATILKNVISIPSNSDVYRAYFQSREFTVLSDAYAIEWIYGDVKLSPNQYLFTVPCINKVTDLSIYSYKNKLGGWNVVQNKYISLPITDAQPDYKKMETLISAIKKLIVKDLVIYTDNKMKSNNV
ncbi:restriction endonuclease subunit S [Aliarcobacter butzleri]|uniref:restriction endonuclease subunit S n=1 Tax=Aliarcobacter butzleri TaxID=28197 RepID=UPI0021B2AFEC|nr:restriction endonuclease subunit S [Aliarcobacter butzleri]MCT7557566.1 restriction endonuclease subunit S [Aliarcobacter butzleri]